MKNLIALFVLAFSLNSVAADKPMKLSKSKCLQDGADALLNWVSENDPTSDFHIIRDSKGYPVQLEDIEGSASLDLYGVWALPNNQEFVQYGDGSGVVMVTMTYNSKTKTCTVVEFDSGQDDGDWE